MLKRKSSKFLEELDNLCIQESTAEFLRNKFFINSSVDVALWTKAQIVDAFEKGHWHSLLLKFGFWHVYLEKMIIVVDAITFEIKTIWTYSRIK